MKFIIASIFLFAIVIQTISSANFGVKQNRCPPALGIGACAEFCSGDDSCSNGQICCSNGCGHQCMNPVSSYDDIVTICQAFCHDDAPCEAGKTCKTVGCMNICVDN